MGFLGNIASNLLGSIGSGVGSLLPFRKGGVASKKAKLQRIKKAVAAELRKVNKMRKVQKKKK